MRLLLLISVLMLENIGNAGIFNWKLRQVFPMERQTQKAYVVEVDQTDKSLNIKNGETDEIEASISLNDYKHADHNESFVCEIVYSSDYSSFAIIFGFSEHGESNPFKFGYKEVKEEPIQLCLVASLRSENLGEVTNLINLDQGIYDVSSLSRRSISFSSPEPKIPDFTKILDE